MAKTRKYRETARIYTPIPEKKKSFGDKLGEVFGALILFFIVGAVLSQCMG